MADPPTDPFARGLIIPPTVCEDVLDTRAGNDWDDIENYVFTEMLREEIIHVFHGGLTGNS